MKTNWLIQTLLTALLLAAAPTRSHAASLLADGNFDTLPAGTRPDAGAPAGHWFLPLQGDREENVPSQVSIAPAPAGGTGNALRYSLAANENPGESVDCYNTLARPVTAASGQIVNVSFDIYVEPGAAGPSLYLGTDGQDQNRTAQLSWYDDGTLRTVNAGSITTLVPAYPRGVWQTVRLTIDLASQRWNFEWSEKGQPVSVTRSNLAFHSATPVLSVNQLVVIRFVSFTAAARGYLDNIQISAGPPAAVMPAYSIVAPGSSVTLSPTNTLAVPSTYQWQLHGTNLPGATSSNLALSNLTLDRSGPYSVIVSNEYELATASPAIVQVATNLLLLSQPQSTNVALGSNVTLRVVAIGPLPITYQWQFNGTNLPGATNASLTLTNVQLDAHTGDYRVQAADSVSDVWSATATLLVLVRPVITNQPLAVTILQGGTATFTVTAGPNHPLNPLGYRWIRSGVPVLTSSVPVFVLTNVQSNATIRVAVTNLTTGPGGINSSTVALTVLADADSDGMADAWETLHGFDSSNPADGALDSDGDGMSNRDEYAAGTDPRGAASVLKLQLARAGDTMALSFPAISNRTYTVEWSTQVIGGTWTRLQDVLAQPLDRTESVADTNATGAMRLYRVMTPRRP